MTSGDDAPSGGTDPHVPPGSFMGRRSFLALGGMAAASAMAVSTLWCYRAVPPLMSPASCRCSGRASRR